MTQFSVGFRYNFDELRYNFDGLRYNSLVSAIMGFRTMFDL